MRIKNASTVIELLVALLIISAAAAYLIPFFVDTPYKKNAENKNAKSTMDSVNTIQTYSKLNNVYSNLQNAFMQISANGSLSMFAGNSDNATAWSGLKQNLNIIKDCGASAGCFASGGYKTINGEAAAPFGESGILSDGTSISIWDFPSDCSTSVCARIYVDINGNNAPNVAGKDFFVFDLYPNGIGYPNYASSDCPSVHYEACTKRVLEEKGMNY